MKTYVTGLLIVSLTVAGCSGQSKSSQNPSGRNKETASPLLPVDSQSLQQSALTVLQNGLKDRNAYIRSYAAESAAVTQRKELMPLIIPLLNDPTVGVRFAAAAASGDMQCTACTKQITALLKDENESVRLAAAYALAKVNQPGHVGMIRASLKSTDQTARANAALLLGKLGNLQDLPLLYNTLHDPDSTEKVRMQAVESIARLGDEKMYRSKLWALQISKYADDRVMGIRGMGALNTPESRNAILTMLTDDIPEVRLAAAEQLARLGDKRGEEEVYRYLQTQPNLNEGNMANSMAIMAIGRLNSPRLNPWLAKAINSQSGYLRVIAAESILLSKDI
jgi:HEAT repeat protein